MEEDIDMDRGGGAGEPRLPVLDEAHSQLIVDDLTAACSSLGKMDQNDGTYMKDRDCKPCLKEIIRHLNHDSRDHVARRTLGALNIIDSDLIPLINQYCDFNDGDTDLFNLIIRICTNLTSSVFLLFENQEIPTDPDMVKVYNKLMTGLYGYKQAFANDSKVWKMLNTHLWHTEDEIPFERLLILLRNILHIPVDSSADLGMHSEFDTHCLCLYRMEQSGLFHTIIRIASETQRGREFCFHMIEIVHLMLRDQNPATVAMSKSNQNKRKLDEEDEDKKRLAELTARDKRESQFASAKFVPPRFKNSLFVVQNYRSIGHNCIVTNRIVRQGDEIAFDTGKTQLRKSKNRKPLSSETSSAVISDRNTKPSQLTYKLKVFSKLFVEKVYANYMQQIKHNLIQKKAAENDESYYLWSIQYFTAFNRLLYMSLDNVSETMSTSTLHFIQILITGYQDKIKIEKKRSEVEKLSKRLHLAVRAYREILNLIKSIEQGSEFWNTIEKIKKNVFTELEYNSLLITLLQQYEEPKHCPEYLKDLISTNDIFLDLLEEYTETHGPVEMNEESDEEENFLDGAVSPDPTEQDVLAQTVEEENRAPSPEQATNEPGHGLDDEDHSSRIHVQTDTIGQTNGQVKTLGVNSEQSVDSQAPVQLEPGEISKSNGPDENDRITGKEKMKEKKNQNKNKKKKSKKKKNKRDLRTVHFMSRYCSPDVIRAYLEVLRDFKRNDSQLNLQILKFFKRVVYECKCEVMLLQVSVLACLLEIVDYHSSLPGHGEFVALSNHLMKIFGEMMEKKRWMIQELLFWKTNSDIIEIENAVDPPRPPSPVARSPLLDEANHDEHNRPHERDMPIDTQSQDREPERRPAADSLEELMAELGSDSSPDVSDNDDCDDEIACSEESDNFPPKVTNTRTSRNIYPSDSDDLSSPPSPVPSASPEVGEVLNDIPNASEDVGSNP